MTRGRARGTGKAGHLQLLEVATSSSGQTDKSEAWEGPEEQEKESEKEKSLNITQEDLWDLQKILSKKKGSFQCNM